MQTSKSVMKPFVGRSSFDVYRVISTKVLLRGGGLNTQTAATHLSLASVDLFFGLPTDLDSLMGLSQVGYKKGFPGHQWNYAGWFGALCWCSRWQPRQKYFRVVVLNKEKLKPAQAVRMIQTFCRTISPRIGWRRHAVPVRNSGVPGDGYKIHRYRRWSWIRWFDWWPNSA